MADIKVGQVWGKQDATNIVITKIELLFDIPYYSYIFADGTCVDEDDKYFITKKRVLLAEYPTWQEAVNSKEFNQ